MTHYIRSYLFNMWLRKLIIFFSVTVLYSQSIHNAYGLGLISFNHNAAAAAMSSRGIVPSFNQNISLSNPVTWNHLKYTYLSGNYNGDEFEGKDCGDRFDGTGTVDNILCGQNNRAF